MIKKAAPRSVLAPGGAGRYGTQGRWVSRELAPDQHVVIAQWALLGAAPGRGRTHAVQMRPTSKLGLQVRPQPAPSQVAVPFATAGHAAQEVPHVAGLELDAH